MIKPKDITEDVARLCEICQMVGYMAAKAYSSDDIEIVEYITELFIAKRNKENDKMRQGDEAE